MNVYSAVTTKQKPEASQTSISTGAEEYTCAHGHAALPQWKGETCSVPQQGPTSRARWGGGENLVSNVAHRAVPIIFCCQEDKVTAMHSRLVVAGETGEGVCGEEAEIKQSYVWDNGDVHVPCSNSCN